MDTVLAGAISAFAHLNSLRRVQYSRGVKGANGPDAAVRRGNCRVQDVSRETGMVTRHCVAGPDDVGFPIGRSKVVRHRSPREATEWARRYYDLGYNQGLGVYLHAECEIGGAAYATIFWTADDRRRHAAHADIKEGVADSKTPDRFVRPLKRR